MAYFNLLLKYFYGSVMDIFKQIFFLNNFNNFEKQGKISDFTKLKIIPKTNVILPFKLGRTIRGLSFKKNIHKDPFAVFVKKMKKGNKKNHLIKFLVSQYKKEKYLNAAKIIKLKNNLTLSKYPAWALIMPWDKQSLNEKFLNYPNVFFENRFKNGLNFQKINNDEFKNFFYSKRNALSQFKQTKILLDSIKKYGFKNSKYLPKIYILIDGKRWRWCMSDEGNHRAYIASINGNINFHCEVSRIINKKDVKSWNNVKNGIYSQKEALSIFKYFFSGSKCLRGIV